MRLALAQINPVVGDLPGNGALLLAACHQAHAAGADLVVAPELALWGYPPRDLLLLPALRQRQAEALDQLAAELPADLALLLGVSEPAPDQRQPDLFNAAALVADGHWRVVARKRLLPSYDVFDERRYFRPADQPCLLELACGDRSWRLGLSLCEDLWVEEALHGQRLVGADPVAELQALRLDLLLNLSASPFAQGKAQQRRALAAAAAQRLSCPVVYVNQVGGNDELVFDGGSFVMGPEGNVRQQLAWAEPDLQVWDAAPPRAGIEAQAMDETGAQLAIARAAMPAIPAVADADRFPLPAADELLLRTLVLGLGDYARKCGFQQALLGLSGGIDSALVAVPIPSRCARASESSIEPAELQRRHRFSTGGGAGRRSPGPRQRAGAADALPLELSRLDRRFTRSGATAGNRHRHAADRVVDGWLQDRAHPRTQRPADGSHR
jgi:NAD+ synthase (glutamine-hydrolysing)